MQHFVTAGLTATVISRRAFDAPAGFTKIQMDLSAPGDWQLPIGAAVISFLPLWVLTKLLPKFVGASAIIATGSTSIFGKAGSSDGHEQSVVAKLEQAEEALQGWGEKHNVNWTILRPTLIYNGHNDHNITRMARFIRHWHFLPLAAPAKGLRQPIHTDDVAKAAFLSLNNQAAVNKAFNIAGGETLSYRAMAERVFTALGKQPRFVMLPVQLLQTMFKIAARAGVIKESNFGAAIFERMNQDLVFDTEEGLKALNYQPCAFHPQFPDLK
jgi:nucleoside-diphosphate-sugar epimerase